MNKTRLTRVLLAAGLAAAGSMALADTTTTYNADGSTTTTTTTTEYQTYTYPYVTTYPYTVTTVPPGTTVYSTYGSREGPDPHGAYPYGVTVLPNGSVVAMGPPPDPSGANVQPALPPVHNWVR
jgi:hypothetical protein